MRSAVPAIALAASLTIASAPGGAANAPQAPRAVDPPARAAILAVQRVAKTAAGGEDPAIAQKVREEYAAWASGSVDFSRYDAAMRKMLTPDLVTDVAAQLKAAGEPSAFIFKGKSTLGDGSNTVYRYRVETAAAPLLVTITYDRSGKISGIYFKPTDE